MVAISQTEGLPHPISQPQTPRRRGDIGRLLKQLNLEYDLDLPWNEHESPSKRPKTPAYKAAQKINVLYFHNDSALDQAVEDFARWLPTLSSKDERLNYLLETLTIATTNRRNTKPPRSARQSPRERDPTRSTNLPEPASPTLSIRHAPPSSFEMPADDFQLSPRNLRRPSLKRPRSSQSLNDRLRASGSRAGPVHGVSKHDENATLPPPPSAHTAGTTSADTSFKSAGMAGNTSFWSEAQHGTQEDPGTPATSVGDSFHTPAEKDMDLGLDGASDLNHSQMTTDYGEWPSQIDGVNDDPVHIALPAVAKLVGQDEPAETHPKPANNPPQSSYHDSQIEDYYRNFQPQLPSPADTVHAPEPHELTGLARVRKLVADGLSNLRLPSSCANMPFGLQWEAMRVLQTGKMSASELDKQWPHPRSMSSLQAVARSRKIKYVRGIETDFSDHNLAAKLRWSRQDRGRVFDLELLPPQRIHSNAFERKYGRDRFLTIDVPPLTTLRDDIGLDELQDEIITQLKELVRHEQSMLGRVWRQFLVQPKKTLQTHDPDFDQPGTVQITFFALRNEPAQLDAISNIPLCEIIDWAVQFDENSQDPECKIYARLDLAASRTTAAFEFTADEIEYDVEDQEPTDDPEDTQFNENGREPVRTKLKQSMNDGCCKISTWAMKRIQEALGLEQIPSVVQGRIFGAKGVWYRDDSEDAEDDEKPKKLIWINKSQMKVRQGSSAWSDSHKLTLNVVRTSTTPHHSQLYADFLPILRDRKVPWQEVDRVVKKNTEFMTKAFEDALRDRRLMRHWIHSQNAFQEERNRENGIQMIGGFPVSKEESAVQMLESGFEPSVCEHLAKNIHDAGSSAFDHTRKHLKLKLLNSTMLLGIADPYGVLKPGEIHVSFSRPFADATQTRNSLRRLHALVARLPALGRSDMQKVRCVFKEELSHLTDVVVFPSRGPCSLAGKLQGGDYDGDTFWICWESSLVKPFQNAPVPIDPGEPKDFGIKVNRTPLADVVPVIPGRGVRDEDVHEWIAKNTSVRMRYNHLGTITLTYMKLVYSENKLGSPRADKLLQLHDLMIDADKQGYELSAKAWNDFLQKYELAYLSIPAYRRFMKGEALEKVKYKKNNVSDHVYYAVAAPIWEEALRQAKDLADHAINMDADLVEPYEFAMKQYSKSSFARRQLQHVEGELAELRDFWNRESQLTSTGKGHTWDELHEVVRQKFEAIVPEDESYDSIATMRLPNGKNGVTQWNRLKASALAKSCEQGTTGALMFRAAGRELCVIKAEAMEGYSRTMDSRAYDDLRPRKRRRAGVDEEIEEEGAARPGDGIERAV